MKRTATKAEEFVGHFNQKQNFLIAPECFAFDMEFPPAEEVIDLLRRDSASKVRTAEVLPKEEEARFTEWVKSAPLEEIMAEQFGISHFELHHFYGPGQFLSQLQDKVMIPWRTLLASLGFTWQRCAPYFFISTKGARSDYHADYSHVVAWQLEGTKTFNGFLDPDKYGPIEELVVKSNSLRSKSLPEYEEADVLAYRMEPGDLLWNQLLTPHWVVAGGDETAMSLNISHGVVRHRGRFGPNEAVLQERWKEHPDEAWMSDLRY